MMQLPIVDSRKKSIFPLARPNAKFNQQTVELDRTHNQEIRSFSELFQLVPGAPKHTAILGQTTDGLPLLFNLTDPRPGSLLVTADRFSNKTTLLKIIATSLARLNRAEEVRFAVITAKSEEWADLESRFPAYFMNIVNSNSVEAEDLIYHLCDLVEARQNGMRAGTAYVLLFDGMEALANMDIDLKANFEWLVRCGASQRIWPVAAIDSNKILANNRYVELFRTRIVGSVNDPQLAARLLPPRFHNNSIEENPRTFTVRIHQHWLQFFIPENLV